MRISQIHNIHKVSAKKNGNEKKMTLSLTVWRQHNKFIFFQISVRFTVFNFTQLPVERPLLCFDLYFFMSAYIYEVSSKFVSVLDSFIS